MTTTMIQPVESLHARLTRLLLLSSPKDWRLDLAIASLLYSIERETVEVIEKGQRLTCPIWYFSDGASERYWYAERDGARLARAGYQSRERVPRFSLNGNYYRKLCDWTLAQIGAQLGHIQSSARLNSSETMIVHISISPTGGEVKSRQEICERHEYHGVRQRLICQVMLDVYAPELHALIESDEVLEPERRGPVSFLDYPRPARAQSFALVPVVLPNNTEIQKCMFQEYDRYTRNWITCKEKDESPEECPACGGVFCEKHSSDLAIWFDITSKEREKLTVCQTCALLPEEDILRLRATRLALNER